MADKPQKLAGSYLASGLIVDVSREDQAELTELLIGLGLFPEFRGLPDKDGNVSLRVSVPAEHFHDLDFMIEHFYRGTLHVNEFWMMCPLPASKTRPECNLPVWMTVKFGDTTRICGDLYRQLLASGTPTGNYVETTMCTGEFNTAIDTVNAGEEFDLVCISKTELSIKKWEADASAEALAKAELLGLVECPPWIGHVLVLPPYLCKEHLNVGMKDIQRRIFCIEGGKVFARHSFANNEQPWLFVKPRKEQL